MTTRLSFSLIITDNSMIASFWEHAEHGSFVVNCYFNPQGFHTYTTVNVKAKTRSEIEKVFNVFEDDHESAKSATISRFSQAEPVVFVGHGQSPIWKELKDHLHEKHGYNVQAYEIGARAGLTIQNILEDMLESASFAVLVMTGEDETAAGKLYPRLNVVHEAGLFQGSLGFERAIVLLERGTEEFSNIVGLQQIRFEKDQISTTFGEVLATLKREFG